MRDVVKYLCLMGMVCLALGCAATQRYPGKTPNKIRVAVMDFAPPDATYYDVKTEQKGAEGWWLGGADVYTDAHVGTHVADEISRRLNQAETITTLNRRAIRQYQAGVADVARQQRPDLDDVAIRQGVQDFIQTYPVQIGRELNVDRVLIGYVEDEKMSMNRASKFWRSRVRARIVMWDVNNEEIVFDRTLSASEWFASAQLTIESLADEFALWLGRRYGYQ